MEKKHRDDIYWTVSCQAAGAMSIRLMTGALLALYLLLFIRHVSDFAWKFPPFLFFIHTTAAQQIFNNSNNKNRS